MTPSSPIIYCHLCGYQPHYAHEIRQVWYHDRLVVECIRTGKSSTHDLRRPSETRSGMSTPIGSTEVM